MWTLLRFELRHVLRDIWQLLLVAVVIPLLLVPFVSRAFRKVQSPSAESRRGTYFVAVDGAVTPPLRELLREQNRFRLLTLQAPAEQALRDGLVDVFLRVESSAPPTPTSDGDPLLPRSLSQRQPGTPLVTVHFNSGRERSRQARDSLFRARNQYLKAVRDRYLSRLERDPGQLFRLEERNLASANQEHLRSLAGLLPLILVFVLFGAGSVTALDAIAGERERGSLATVLVSALTYLDIAVGKWLCVLLVSLGFGLLQFIGLYFSTGGLGGQGLRSLDLPAWSLLLLLLLLLAAQVSALLLWISARSSSFKQAQLLYMPALLIGAMLAGAAWLENLPLHSVVLAVPISGLSLAVRDVLLGQLSFGWLLLAVLASLGWTGWALYATAANLQLEEEPGSDEPREQSRRQLAADIPWFYAVAAALMVILPGNFSQLSGLRGQVLLNQGIFLILAPALLLYYRQPLRAGLRWHGTGWKNWAICLLLAPVLHLCANSVAIFSSWLVPMSAETMRQMTELLLPAGVSQLELLLLIAVSPALCEELAFRGTLLYALQKPGEERQPRLTTCLKIGLIFGCFHFSLQRLLPTAVIGSVLSWIALRSGSLWPGMLLHFVNNALALALHFLHIEYTGLPGWTWFACWALLAYLIQRIQPR